MGRKLYVARDKDDRLFLFSGLKPIRYVDPISPNNVPTDIDECYWTCQESISSDTDTEVMLLSSKLFPNVKWEDKEPTEVVLMEVVRNDIMNIID